MNNAKIYRRKLRVRKTQTLYRRLEDAPTADVAPVVHGHWIFGEFDGIGRPVWCSECGNRTKNVADPVAWLNYPEHKYCGRCGAKMDKNTEVK